jgi:hypothetical protein
LLGFAATTGSAVLTILLTNGASMAAAWCKRRNAAGHLALLLAVLFEEFADRCSSAAADIELYHDSRGATGGVDRGIPDLGQMLDDSESWRALDPELRNRCLSFPHAVRWSIGYLKFKGDVDPDPTGDGAGVRRQLMRLGLEALGIAGALRSKYKWSKPERPYASGDWMREALEKIGPEE